MARITCEIHLEGLEKIANNMRKIADHTLYEGANPVATAMHKGVSAIPTESRTHRNGDPWWGTEGHYPIHGCTAEEKAQIESNFGIANFRHKGGTVDTIIGFTGMMTTSGGKEIAVGQFAQAVNDGTAFRQGCHTMRPGDSEQGAAEAAMQAELDKQIDEYMG